MPFHKSHFYHEGVVGSQDKEHFIQIAFEMLKNGFFEDPSTKSDEIFDMFMTKSFINDKVGINIRQTMLRFTTTYACEFLD